jgi:hypothetical protein
VRICMRRGEENHNSHYIGAEEREGNENTADHHNSH